MKKNVNNVFNDYFIVYIGCLLQAFAVTCILRPNNLVVGGFTGLSMAIGYIIHVDYTIIYYTLCLLILIATWIVLGKKDAIRIMLLSITYPIILMIFENFSFNFIEGPADKLLICIYYGIISGFAMGLILKRGFSQGSSDTLAKIIQKKFLPFVNIGKVLLGIDIAVLLICGFIFGRTAILYALLMQVIYSKTVDFVVLGFGTSFVKLIILTEKPTEVTDYILNTIHRGVSTSSVTGARSNKENPKLICICSTKELILIKNFVATADKEAFVNAVPVLSVWGKGYDFNDLEVE
ncbi:MAG: YitT family protein [Niameybacter sp.]